MALVNSCVLAAETKRILLNWTILRVEDEAHTVGDFFVRTVKPRLSYECGVPPQSIYVGATLSWYIKTLNKHNKDINSKTGRFSSLTCIARNKRTRTYIFRILFRLRYRRSQWQTLGAWYKASALGLYVRGICPPIIV